jgi:hypothetical protein
MEQVKRYFIAFNSIYSFELTSQTTLFVKLSASIQVLFLAVYYLTLQRGHEFL